MASNLEFEIGSHMGDQASESSDLNVDNFTVTYWVKNPHRNSLILMGFDPNSDNLDPLKIEVEMPQFYVFPSDVGVEEILEAEFTMNGMQPLYWTELGESRNRHLCIADFVGLNDEIRKEKRYQDRIPWESSTYEALLYKTFSIKNGYIQMDIDEILKPNDMDPDMLSVSILHNTVTVDFETTGLNNDSNMVCAVIEKFGVQDILIVNRGAKYQITDEDTGETILVNPPIDVDVQELARRIENERELGKGALNVIEAETEEEFWDQYTRIVDELNPLFFCSYSDFELKRMHGRTFTPWGLSPKFDYWNSKSSRGAGFADFINPLHLNAVSTGERSHSLRQKDLISLLKSFDIENEKLSTSGYARFQYLIGDLDPEGLFMAGLQCHEDTDQLKQHILDNLHLLYANKAVIHGSFSFIDRIYTDKMLYSYLWDRMRFEVNYSSLKNGDVKELARGFGTKFFVPKNFFIPSSLPHANPENFSEMAGVYFEDLDFLAERFTKYLGENFHAKFENMYNIESLGFNQEYLDLDRSVQQSQMMSPLKVLLEIADHNNIYLESLLEQPNLEMGVYDRQKKEYDYKRMSSIEFETKFADTYGIHAQDLIAEFGDDLNSMLNLRRVIGQHIHASKGPLFVARDGFENSTFGSEKTNLFVSCGFSPGHIPIGYFDRGNANVSVNGSRRVVVDSHKYDLTHKFGLNHYEKFSYAASDVMSELILLVNAFEKHAEKTITTFRVDGREKESHVIATENLQDVKGGQLIAIDEHGAFMGIIAKQDDEFYFSDFDGNLIEGYTVHGSKLRTFDKEIEIGAEVDLIYSESQVVGFVHFGEKWNSVYSVDNQGKSKLVGERRGDVDKLISTFGYVHISGTGAFRTDTKNLVGIIEGKDEDLRIIGFKGDEVPFVINKGKVYKNKQKNVGEIVLAKGFEANLASDNATGVTELTSYQLLHHSSLVTGELLEQVIHDTRRDITTNYIESDEVVMDTINYLSYSENEQTYVDMVLSFSSRVPQKGKKPTGDGLEDKDFVYKMQVPLDWLFECEFDLRDGEGSSEGVNIPYIQKEGTSDDLSALIFNKVSEKLTRDYKFYQGVKVEKVEFDYLSPFDRIRNAKAPMKQFLEAHLKQFQLHDSNGDHPVVNKNYVTWDTLRVENYGNVLKEFGFPVYDAKTALSMV